MLSKYPERTNVWIGTNKPERPFISENPFRMKLFVIASLKDSGLCSTYVGGIMNIQPLQLYNNYNLQELT